MFGVLRQSSIALGATRATLGHEMLDLVKLDVEGAEYDALSEMLRMDIFPTQVLVEFYHRFPGIGQRKTLE